jgi:hypothetical protein
MAQSLPVIYNGPTFDVSAETAGREGKDSRTGRGRRQAARAESAIAARPRRTSVRPTQPRARYHRLPTGWIGRAIGTYLDHRDLSGPVCSVSCTA